MSASPYSSDKVLFHADRLLALRQGDTIAPLHVQLIISDLCNQDCNFCAYRMEGYSSNELFEEIRQDGSRNHNPRRFLLYDKILEILDDCQEMGVKAIQITGGGEPSVHPHFEEVLDAVLARGLELALVTNGLRLTTDEMTRLLRATWVRVSIDAATPETYSRIRRTPFASFGRVLSHVGELVRMKREAASSVTIGLGFVVTKDNWHEVLDATRLARDLGVDNLRISAVFQADQAAYFDGFYREAASLCQEAVATYASERFHVVNNFGERVDDLAIGHPDYRYCGYQSLTTYIGADQNVYRCCVLAYSTRGLLGSLQTQRFKDLWRARGTQADFDAHDCPRCQFNGKNKAILSVLVTPTHENFV